jgi:hypothetical protein
MKFSMEQVCSLQDLIIASIFEVPTTVAEVPKVSGFLRELLDTDAELLKLSLGDCGTRLRVFAEAIDTGHPGLTAVCDGAFIKPSIVARKISQYTLLAKFAKEHGLCEVLEDIPKYAVKGINKNIRHMEKTQCVRLLKNRADRDEIRQIKQTKQFDIQFLSKKDKFNWDSHPNDFAMYVRNSRHYEEEIEKAKKKALRFKALNCTALYKEILNSITEFREEFEHNYYGFHHITVSRSAVVLARMHGMQFQTSPFRIYGHHSYGGDYNYTPHIYPFHQLNALLGKSMPESVQKIVEHLEQFPAANNRAIFDHYLVIVPGMSTYPSFMESDLECLKQHYTCAVLLGEVEGKCYFISYVI